MAITNPIQLPPRFEIRPLEEIHIPWTQAIITHSNVFCSPVWVKMYPSNQTERAYRMFTSCERLMTLNTQSGYSYGVFDKEYKFKRPESEAVGGRLYWDLTNRDATANDLLEQMDFPLVSIAMAYDLGEERDGSEWGPVVEALPGLGKLFGIIGQRDVRPPEAQKPKGLGEMISRGGTSTRADYEGFKLAKLLGHWVLFQWANQGFKGMAVGTAHPAVNSIFENPPPPFKGEVVSQFNTAEYEEEVDGQKVKPFAVAGDINCQMVYVTLK